MYHFSTVQLKIFAINEKQRVIWGLNTACACVLSSFLIWMNYSFKGRAEGQVARIHHPSGSNAVIHLWEASLKRDGNGLLAVQQDLLHPPEPVLTGSVLHWDYLFGVFALLWSYFTVWLFSFALMELTVQVLPSLDGIVC